MPRKTLHPPALPLAQRVGARVGLNLRAASTARRVRIHENCRFLSARPVASEGGGRHPPPQILDLTLTAIANLGQLHRLDGIVAKGVARRADDVGAVDHARAQGHEGAALVCVGLKRADVGGRVAA